MAQVARFPWGLDIVVETHQHLDATARTGPGRGIGQNKCLLCQGKDEGKNPDMAEPKFPLTGQMEGL